MWEMTCTINNLQGELMHIICRLYNTLQIDKLILVSCQQETRHIHLFAFLTHSAEGKVTVVVDRACPILWNVKLCEYASQLRILTIFLNLFISFVLMFIQEHAKFHKSHSSVKRIQVSQDKSSMARFCELSKEPFWVPQ